MSHSLPAVNQVRGGLWLSSSGHLPEEAQNKAEESPLPERYGYRMKAIQHMKRAAAWSLSALALSAVLMGAVACTRGNNHTPGDTTVTTTVTTPATETNGTGTDTARPLDPDAGTVDTNDNAGDPPAGTESGSKGRSVLPRMMN